MKKWKTAVHHKGKIIEIKINAKSFSDAYLKISKKYDGGVIKSISEIRPVKGGSTIF